jgi:hypothetical protein
MISGHQVSASTSAQLAARGIKCLRLRARSWIVPGLQPVPAEQMLNLLPAAIACSQLEIELLSEKAHERDTLSILQQLIKQVIQQPDSKVQALKLHARHTIQKICGAF